MATYTREESNVIREQHDERTARLDACLGEKTVRSFAEKKVAVIGLGALGGPMLNYLSMLGIRQFLLVDPGIVEPANLGNQSFDAVHVGMLKVEARTLQIKRVNPRAHVGVFAERLEMLGRGTLWDCDLVVSCLDNLATRVLLNEICCGVRIPWVDAATDGSGKFMIGRVASFGAHPDAPCFVCAFGHEQLAQAVTSERVGCPSWWNDPAPSRPTLSIPPECGIIAGIQCIEAIKRLRGDLSARISTEMFIDLDQMKLHSITLQHNPKCLNSHQAFGELVSLSADTSIGATLNKLSEQGGSDASIMLHGKSFITHVRCSTCGRHVPVGKIDLALTLENTRCPCGQFLAPNPFSRHEVLDAKNASPFLDRSWKEIGLPLEDIISGVAADRHVDYRVVDRTEQSKGSH